ncbi:PIN domain protein [Longimicrobium terrae]|uniref:Putative nucleic acid-binding protein n=1 Tax=Longimicrobium terrae TaxID=1639882 RepID=A0A841H4Y3_9BACT|nr:PIN domain protein [Longimicrobium terrae]MBB4638784.1 putative nucleic acid-binding protein [Longimicrobium terrae]MBB6073023.1 putative nucleic acid-binding protein [Longimicrobium terrae]NNC33146.1 PIN domain protein [Longimicrobium terrae]
MSGQRIYIDTSVIGGCFDSEFAPWSTGLFTDFRLGIYRPVVSEVVEAELVGAPTPVKELWIELLDLHAEMLFVGDEVDTLAKMYEAREILSPKYFNDGLHIALATVAEVDSIVSWNFKHIVNYRRMQLFNAANRDCGYSPVHIRTPREVTRHGRTED